MVDALFVWLLDMYWLVCVFVVYWLTGWLDSCWVSIWLSVCCLMHWFVVGMFLIVWRMCIVCLLSGWMGVWVVVGGVCVW